MCACDFVCVCVCVFFIGIVCAFACDYTSMYVHNCVCVCCLLLASCVHLHDYTSNCVHVHNRVCVCVLYWHCVCVSACRFFIDIVFVYVHANLRVCVRMIIFVHFATSMSICTLHAFLKL